MHYVPGRSRCSSNATGTGNPGQPQRNKIVQDVIEEHAEWFGGEEIPIHTTVPNPNGVGYDNLYLVGTFIVTIMGVMWHAYTSCAVATLCSGS